MSTERPNKNTLIFQCDTCYDTHEFSKHDGDPVHNYQECWRFLHGEGWTIFNSDHRCDDCTQIAKTERERRI